MEGGEDFCDVLGVVAPGGTYGQALDDWLGGVEGAGSRCFEGEVCIGHPGLK